MAAVRPYGRSHAQLAPPGWLRLVSTLAVRRGRYETDALVAAATSGDRSAFSELVERHRHELQRHAYRMLGSHEDSEDLAQEAFLRAWRKRESFRGQSSYRSWLYRIATNACLTALEQRARRRQTSAGAAEAQMAPPDQLLEALAASGEPDTDVASKETIELVFLVAVKYLPPKQRAVLFLRDALGWSAKDTAALLGISLASVTSALQRARATLRRHLPGHRLEWVSGLETTEEERALLRRCLEAAERADAGAFAAMLREHRSTESAQPLRGGERHG